MRKNNPAAKSNVYRFTNEHTDNRIVQLEKYDMDYKDMLSHDFENSSYDKEKLTIILNCSDTPANIYPDGKILFSNLFKNDVLSPNGTLIYKTNKKGDALYGK